MSEPIDWQEMYLTLAKDWGALCDLAGVEGDSAPFEVVHALRDTVHLAQTVDALAIRLARTREMQSLAAYDALASDAIDALRLVNRESGE